MRIILRASLIFLLTFQAWICVAQSEPTAVSSSTNPLARMLQLSGWTTVPTDAIAVGQIRDAGSATGVDGTLTVTARGWEEVRYDVTSSGATTTTIVNGTRAVRIAGGETKNLPIAFAVSTRVPILPFLTSVTRPGALQAINYLRVETVGSEAADAYELIPAIDSTDISSEFREKAERYTLWISRTTGLLIQFAYVRLGSNPAIQLHYLRRYSNYRAVGGVLVPMHQEEWLEGQPESVLDLTSVTLNSGVSDSTFFVPSIRQEAQ